MKEFGNRGAHIDSEKLWQGLLHWRVRFGRFLQVNGAFEQKIQKGIILRDRFDSFVFGVAEQIGGLFPTVGAGTGHQYGVVGDDTFLRYDFEIGGT